MSQDNRNAFSSMIEAQEKSGQTQFVKSETLPVEGTSGKEGESLTKLGFILRDPVQGDPIFRHVQFPPGWSKRPTDHSMWSDLVDDKGRKRAAIFYKAAFYDRSAHMYLVRRFTIEREYLDGDDGQRNYNKLKFVVKDGDKVVFEAPVTIRQEMPIAGDRANWAKYDQAEVDSMAPCVQWLRDHGFVNYDDPTAHWD